MLVVCAHYSMIKVLMISIIKLGENPGKSFSAYFFSSPCLTKHFKPGFIVRHVWIQCGTFARRKQTRVSLWSHRTILTSTQLFQGPGNQKCSRHILCQSACKAIKWICTVSRGSSMGSSYRRTSWKSQSICLKLATQSRKITHFELRSKHTVTKQLI